MQSLNDIFGSEDSFLDEEMILGLGNYGAGYKIKAPRPWTEYERIEVGIRVSGKTDQVDSIEGVAIGDKDYIASKPTDFVVAFYVDLSNYSSNGIVATGIDTATPKIYSASKVRYIKGFFRRYSTTNSSKIINVNGGNNVTTNKRYEIDILSSLGKEYLGSDLIVQSEVYNNTNTGVAGWAKSTWFYHSGGNNGQGINASVLNDKIIVQTGGGSLSGGVSRHDGLPFNQTKNLTSAPCRVKVWKVDQFLPKETDAGGSKNAPYITERGGNAATGYYEKWSDGYIRQWGSVFKVRTYINTEVIKVAMPIKFSKVESMSIQVTWYGRQGSGSANMATMEPTSVSEISILPDGSHTGSLTLRGYSWEVQGY